MTGNELLTLREMGFHGIFRERERVRWIGSFQILRRICFVVCDWLVIDTVRREIKMIFFS